MAIISDVLSKIKSDPLVMLGGGKSVDELFARAGHRWRKRTLTPARTVGLFILQILCANTSIADVLRLAESKVSESSYCAARMRLPLAGLARLIEVICESFQPASTGLFQGHRVLLADATSVTTPDVKALQKRWPQSSSQKKGCGFPIIKLLGVFDASSGLIRQMIFSALCVHESTLLMQLGAALRPGDVVLADRGFCSFVNVAMLHLRHACAVFRMHQKVNVDFTPNRPHGSLRGKKQFKGKTRSRYIRSLGAMDQLVEWMRPRARPKWLSAAEWVLLPATIQIRELRYVIERPGYRTRVVTIATTLLDPMRYPKAKIAELYGLRWEVELNFRHLKQTLKMDQLKCQTPDGVIGELMIYVLIYNLVRMKMLEAAGRQNVDVSRISFIDAWRTLRCNPDLTECRPIKRNPIRPGRSCPRVRKRRPKKYCLMTKPRPEYEQPTQEEELMA